MGLPKFLWDIKKKKKIKVKEIREHNIVWNKEKKTWEVIVYGFFGGGVVILQNPDEEECRKYIDSLTGEEEKRNLAPFGGDTGIDADFYVQGK